MDHSDPYPLTREKTEKHLLLLELAAMFTRAKFCAGQAKDLFAAIADMLNENKKARPDGGLDAFLESLYEKQADLPIDLIERVLVEALRVNSYREILARRFEKLAEEIEAFGELSLPYRDWLKAYYGAEAKRKEENKPTNRWKSKGTAWPKASDIIEPDDESGD